MHDLVMVGIPLIAILAGILFNRSDSANLRTEIAMLRTEMNGRFGEMNGRFGEMNGRFNKVEDHLSRIDADLRYFYQTTGKIDARMDALEKQ